jgi:flagellar basal body-associated protein FliL
MSLPVEKNEPPKRSRIVVQFERAREMAHVPKKGSRGARVFLLVLIILASLLVGLAIGFFFWWRSYKTGPAYSLALLVDAAQRNDAAGIDEIVDTKKVVENFAPQVTEQAAGRLGTALTPALRKQIEALVPKLLPHVEQDVHDEVIRQVKELGARAEGKPFILIALSIPYIMDISEDGDTARAVATQNERTIELTMQRNGERWKITGVKDEALAKRIVDNIARDLPAIGAPLEKELRKQIKKNLPNGVTDVLGMGDDDKKDDKKNK